MKPTTMYPIPGENKGEKAMLHPSQFAKAGLLTKDNHEGILVLNAIFALMGEYDFRNGMEEIIIENIDNAKKIVEIRFVPSWKTFHFAWFIHRHTRLDLEFGQYKIDPVKKTKIPNFVLRVRKSSTPYGVAAKMIGADGVSSRIRMTNKDDVASLMDLYGTPAYVQITNGKWKDVILPETNKKPFDISLGASWGDVWSKELTTLAQDLTTPDDRSKIILTMVGLAAAGIIYMVYVKPMLGGLGKGIDR